MPRFIDVQDSYRKNPLSFRPGGYTVYVEKYDGTILKYDKVKDPHVYIRKMHQKGGMFKTWWTK